MKQQPIQILLIILTTIFFISGCLLREKLPTIVTGNPYKEIFIKNECDEPIRISAIGTTAPQERYYAFGRTLLFGDMHNVELSANGGQIQFLKVYSRDKPFPKGISLPDDIQLTLYKGQEQRTYTKKELLDPSHYYDDGFVEIIFDEAGCISTFSILICKRSNQEPAPTNLVLPPSEQNNESY